MNLRKYNINIYSNGHTLRTHFFSKLHSSNQPIARWSFRWSFLHAWSSTPKLLKARSATPESMGSGRWQQSKTSGPAEFHQTVWCVGCNMPTVVFAGEKKWGGKKTTKTMGKKKSEAL